MERQWSANSGFISKFLTNIAKMVEFNEVQVTTVPLMRHSCGGTLLSGINTSCLRNQASSVLSHWITEYVHVFCPSGQPSAVQICSGRFSPAKNMPE